MQINSSLYEDDINVVTIMKYSYQAIIFSNILFNIYRFIGELYKQQILTTKIMHRCIRHLLDQNDEDNLECLCKLLTTIGKDLEAKGPAEVNLNPAVYWQ